MDNETYRKSKIKHGRLCRPFLFYKNGGFVKTTGANGYRRVYSDNIFIGIGIVNDGVLRPKRTI